MFNYNHRTHNLIITFFVFTILLVCCTPGYLGLGLFIIYIYFLMKYSPSYTNLGMLMSELSIYQFLSHLGVSFVQTCDVYFVITHLLSIEGADWPKLHDTFKTRDAKTWQRKFPEGFRLGFMPWICYWSTFSWFSFVWIFPVQNPTNSQINRATRHASRHKALPSRPFCLLVVALGWIHWMGNKVPCQKQGLVATIYLPPSWARPHYRIVNDRPACRMETWTFPVNKSCNIYNRFCVYRARFAFSFRK